MMYFIVRNFVIVKTVAKNLGKGGNFLGSNFLELKIRSSWSLKVFYTFKKFD